MSEPVLKAGIIGLGVGARHIAGYEADPRCRVVALCDINSATLAEVGAQHPGRRLTTDAMDIINDPQIDIVSICSYDDAHTSQIEAAIFTGKHIFVEKPICQFEEELGRIAGLMAAYPGIKISSNLILRRTPRFMELRRRIASGAMGKVYCVEGDYDYGRVHKILSGWRADIPYYSVIGGGGIHIIDLMLWLTGGVVEEVMAYGNKIVTAGTAFRHADCALALLRFRDGMLAKVSANFGCVAPHHHRLSVYGTEATYAQGHPGAAYFHSRDPASAPEAVTDPYPGAAKGDMLPSFIRHILDGTPADVSARDVLDAMAIALAIERSMKSGRPEKVIYVS